MTQGTDIPSSIAAPYGYVVNLIKNNLLYGTHANRPLASVPPDGALYFETDTTIWYQIQNVAWAQVSPATAAAHGAPILIAASNATANEKLWAVLTGGLVCTGTNDQTIINAILAGLTRTTMQEVDLVGSFSISGQITGVSNVILKLQGKVQLATAANCNMLSFTSETNFQVIGGEWDGNKANQTAVGSYLMVFDTCTNFLVSGCTVHDAYKYLAPTGTAGYGIYPTSCNDATFEKNTIYNCGNIATDQTNGIGFMLSGNSVRCKIINNTVHDCDGGIYLWVGAGQTCTNNLIEDNIVYNTSRDGIICYANGGTVGQNTITGNWVSDAGIGSIHGNSCINIGNIAASNNNTVTGNTIVGVNANAGYGITIYGNYNTVSGNTIYNVCKTAITILNGIRNTVSGNNIDTVQNTGYGGIAIDGSVRNLVSNNTIRGTRNGIWLLDTATNNFIFGNYMIDSAFAWLRAEAAADTANIIESNIYITGDTLTNNGTANTFLNNTAN